ncbi:Membrane or secreted protein [Gillisia hiemivivida]|jgi:signal peptidase I
MKDCCKTGIEKDQKQGGFKKWFNYILYAIIAAVIIGTLVFQIFS